MKNIRRSNTFERGFFYLLVSLSSIFCLAFILTSISPESNRVSAVSSTCTSGIELSATNATIDVATTNYNGGFGFGYLTVSICTPSASSSGYTLSMETADPTNNRLEYFNRAYTTQGGARLNIASITEEKEVNSVVNSFPVNTWGYNYVLSDIDNHTDGIDPATGYGIYKPIPIAATNPADKIVKRSIRSGLDTAKIYFGVKANSELVYGDYSNTIVFTAVANTVVTTDFATAFSFYGKSSYGETGYYAMQDMTANICNSVSYNQSTTLIDTRNNATYTVAKLADGNCWMTSDLALGSNTQTALSNVNTDLNTRTGWALPALLSDPANSSSSSASAYKESDETFYNWFAAIAEATTAESTSAASDSICPAGWRLPHAEITDGEQSLRSLLNAYSVSNDATGVATLTSSPLSFNDGSYWTSQYDFEAIDDAMLVIDSGANSVSFSAEAKNTLARVRCVVHNNDPIADAQQAAENSDGVEPVNNRSGNSFSANYLAGSLNNNSNDVNQDAGALGVEETEISEETLARVAYVESLIERLPSASEVTLEYSDLIEETIAAYEKLSDFERSLIDSHLIKKYSAVVAAYNSLKSGGNSLNTVAVGVGLGLAAVATGVIVVAAAKKKRKERYYGEE